MVDIDIFLRDNYPFEQFTIIVYPTTWCKTRIGKRIEKKIRVCTRSRAKNKPPGPSINGVVIFKNTHYLSFPTLFIYKKSML